MRRAHLKSFAFAWTLLIFFSSLPIFFSSFFLLSPPLVLNSVSTLNSHFLSLSHLVLSSLSLSFFVLLSLSLPSQLLFRFFSLPLSFLISLVATLCHHLFCKSLFLPLTFSCCSLISLSSLLLCVLHLPSGLWLVVVSASMSTVFLWCFCFSVIGY